MFRKAIALIALAGLIASVAGWICSNWLSYEPLYISRIEGDETIYTYPGWNWHTDVHRRIRLDIISDPGRCDVRLYLQWFRPSWIEPLCSDFHYKRRVPSGDSSIHFNIRYWLASAIFSLVAVTAFALPAYRKFWRRKRLRCLNCGYRLEGLRSDSCPECGAAASAFAQPQRQPR